MTSEPWVPELFDDAPYESALGETPSHASSGLTADGVSPSAPVPSRAAAATPAGALHVPAVPLVPLSPANR